MDDLVVEFLTETNESIDEIDVDLVNLEQNPNDTELLGKIFRLVHTIKGTCGFLDLPRLEKVAHHAENVLGRFRDGDLEVIPEYVTLIFESIDRIKFILKELEKTGKEPEGDDSAIIAKLDAAYEGKVISDDEAAEEEPLAAAEKIEEVEAEEAVEEAQPEEEIIELIIKERTDLAPGDASMEELEAAFAAAPGMEGIVNPADLEKQKQAKQTTEAKVSEEPKIDEVLVNETGSDSGDDEYTKTETRATANQTLRVNVDVLEDLMTMVSELVLTRNQLLQIVRAEGETAFTTPLQRLNHVVSELQEGVMKTRMQPIGNAWSKLPRIIRDLSIELGKKVNLDMHGQDTELDRQVLEMIKDPLTHMVRNSGDHGIELPAERIAAGKSETGTIKLNAYHEGGHIIIKISDDGKGLNEEKIREKILNNGLATAEELKEMSSQQVQQFIFKPGFSTAEKVTSVSGRGVGMDVVRTNIERIGGSVELKSTEGKGSIFTIKIPLTLAIVHALIVEAAGERFAIPQLSVSELVMVSDHGDNRIEYIKGAPVFRLRDRLLPLVSLSEVLCLASESILKPEKEEPKEEVIESAAEEEQEEAVEETGEALDAIGPEQEKALVKSLKRAAEKTKKEKKKEKKKLARNLYIVIAEVGGYQFGIIVDRVFDTEEIVVKPVAQMLKGLKLFSGNTILGDGSVIMILDPNGIANASGGIDNIEEDATMQGTKHRADSEKKTSLLLFNVGDNTPKAVPLSLVARLENIRKENIEYSSGQMMMQYRGTLMPLVPFSNSVKIDEEHGRPVLVFADKDRSMGIIVNDIVDIIEEHIDVKLNSSQKGLLGSAIINGAATDVVDIAHFLNDVNKTWFRDHNNAPFGEGDEEEIRGKKRVLLIDDSPFFRNMLTPVLSVAGYEVTTLNGPTEALKLQEEGVSFDIIVSDIEMPDIDGFEFARMIRSEGGLWADTPMVALSSHATPKDIERGMSSGYRNYVAKFDKETLLSAIAKTLDGR